MAGNSTGTLFRISTFGESHGPALGVIMDGLPAGIRLDPDKIQQQLDRRRPGQGKLTSARKETDKVRFLSGLTPDGRTLGQPVAAMVENVDIKSSDYDALKGKFRPGHADYPTWAKFGIRDHRGGGRASARETVARVIAGSVARQVLDKIGISILGYATEIGGIKADMAHVSMEKIESTPVRCPDPKAAVLMEKAILQARDNGDSLGGVVEIVGKNVPAGLGDPVFDKLSARISGAMMSVPATRGVEIGIGFEAARLSGKKYPDVMDVKDGKVVFESNRHGGILGGISSGQDIVVRVAFKPTSTLPGQEAELVTEEMKKEKIRLKGRHDPCVVPRAVPILEAVMACVLLDAYLMHRSRENFPGADLSPWKD